MDSPQKLILVVDDERDIVEIICDILSDAGFKTMTAYDGQQALEKIERQKPDMLVLDMKMPVLDGLGVIRHLRADPFLSDIPIVVVTATQVIIEVQERYRQLGVSACIAKPFEPEELLAAVTNALEMKNG